MENLKVWKCIENTLQEGTQSWTSHWVLISSVQYILMYHSLQQKCYRLPGIHSRFIPGQHWAGIAQNKRPVRLPKKNIGVRNAGCHCPDQRFDLNFKKKQNLAQFRFLVAISSSDQPEELRAMLETYEALQAQVSFWMIIQMEP